MVSEGQRGRLGTCTRIVADAEKGTVPGLYSTGGGIDTVEKYTIMSHILYTVYIVIIIIVGCGHQGNNMITEET